MHFLLVKGEPIYTT